LDLKQNRGKGFAVKQGIFKTRGKFILMADADAATDIKDLPKLEKNIKDVVVGSRAHLTKENQVKV
jgi:dolichyl-phosphate beta-glucosyltransferase